MKRLAKILFAASALALFLVALFFASQQLAQKFFTKPKQNQDVNILIISDQPAGKTLRIKETRLEHGGFVVVRNAPEADASSRIAGISRYLFPTIIYRDVPIYSVLSEEQAKEILKPGAILFATLHKDADGNKLYGGPLDPPVKDRRSTIISDQFLLY